MTLSNLFMIDRPEPVNIQITGHKIGSLVLKPFVNVQGLNLVFKGAMVFPGLINSHDHLDFNLFPSLGDRIYQNYTEWGKHIHAHYPTEISAVLKVPIGLREQWGIFKNLICGVTTVVNHGEKLTVKSELITVHEQYYCLHSVGFEKEWRIKLNHPLKRKYPVVIHIGEGTDLAASNEIDQLIRWNLLQKILIGIHAVAMSVEQAGKFKAIVWCPQSNYFLLNRTAPVDVLKSYTKILFGTDSTLTGNWDMWDHIRLARKTKKLTDRELYETLNLNPAATWKIPTGEIAEGKDADLVVARVESNENKMESFYSIEPKDLLLVVQKGNIRMFDVTLLDQLTSVDLSGFSKINIDGISKYVDGDVPGLIKEIKEYYPKANFPIKIN